MISSIEKSEPLYLMFSNDPWVIFVNAVWSDRIDKVVEFGLRPCFCIASLQNQKLFSLGRSDVYSLLIRSKAKYLTSQTFGVWENIVRNLCSVLIAENPVKSTVTCKIRLERRISFN